MKCQMFSTLGEKVKIWFRCLRCLLSAGGSRPGRAGPCGALRSGSHPWLAQWALLVSALLAAALAGCGATPDAGPEEASAEHIVTGDVLYRERQALPPGAVVVVSARDLESGEILVEERLEARHEVPIPFRLELRRDQLESAGNHGLQARILDGGGRTAWHTPQPVPIDVSGPRSRAELLLRAGDGEDSAFGEHSRRVDFRARGSDPDWELEVIDGERMAMAWDDGSNRVYTPAPEPTFSGARMTYHSRTDNHDLLVRVYRESCEEEEEEGSGTAYPYTVDVELDGRLFSGCGRGG